MKLKRRNPQPEPERSVLLVGGPFDSRTLYNPLPEVGESVLLSFDGGGDQHTYRCETPGTATYAGTTTEHERARRYETRISQPASDPTK
jgi:hypothetical protein